MNSLILGAGFIGSRLAYYLVEQGESVTVFTREGNEQLASLQQAGCKVVIGDFCQLSDYLELLGKTDIVYHLISTTVPKTSNDDPIHDINSNLCATVQLIKAVSQCRKRGRRPPKIIFVSSGGTVYGTPEYLPIDEVHKTDPVCSYGVVKLAIEKYLSIYSRTRGIDYVVLRISNPYGEYLRNDKVQGVIPVCLHKIWNNQPIEIWGNGSAVRDYIHIGDVVVALYNASLYRGKRRVLNIGSGTGLSLLELLTLMERITEKKLTKRFISDRKCDVNVNYLDISAAQKEMGWVPHISLEDGMAKVWKWLEMQKIA